MQNVAAQFGFISFPEIYHSFVSKVLTEETFNHITQVANKVFLHLATSLSINAFFYLAFGALAFPISATVLTIACGASLAFVIALKLGHVAYHVFHPKTPTINSSPKSSIGSLASSLADFSIVNTLTLQASLYIHEAGHAIAAITCFIQANPTVLVKWASGLTQYNISFGLTKFGGWLGEQTARLFITAAGLFTPSLFALAEFSLAYGLHNSYPWISDMLNYHGLSQLLNVGLYGISALFTSKMALNDFSYLWFVGQIHPAIAVALLVGIPVCAFLAFKYLEYRKASLL
jgi:hypothetical protein